MQWSEFWLLFALCVLAMAICRIVPLLAVREKTLSKNVEQALQLIPPAAYAALCANDLFKPETFLAFDFATAMPFLAALFVIVVSLWKKSLILSTIVGCVSFGVMGYFSGAF